jgi:hypothetical protein
MKLNRNTSLNPLKIVWQISIKISPQIYSTMPTIPTSHTYDGLTADINNSFLHLSYTVNGTVLLVIYQS